MKKIKVGDHVVVIAGKDKGRKGIVLSSASNGRIVVRGVAVSLKAIRPNAAKQIVGGLVAREKSIHVSNVALWDDEANRPSRVGIRLNSDGKRERFLKRSGRTVSV